MSLCALWSIKFTYMQFHCEYVSAIETKRIVATCRIQRENTHTHTNKHAVSRRENRWSAVAYLRIWVKLVVSATKAKHANKFDSGDNSKSGRNKMKYTHTHTNNEKKDKINGYLKWNRTQISGKPVRFAWLTLLHWLDRRSFFLLPLFLPVFVSLSILFDNHLVFVLAL